MFSDDNDEFCRIKMKCTAQITLEYVSVQIKMVTICRHFRSWAWMVGVEARFKYELG
jgi:hypothetical protein